MVRVIERTTAGTIAVLLSSLWQMAASSLIKTTGGKSNLFFDKVIH